MIEVKAPNAYNSAAQYTIFMAGSIEMGVAVDWQTQLRNDLIAYQVLLLNPRRDDWNSDWVQDISNDQFRTQVEWELNGIDNSDLVVVNFEPGTQSPITLMELGLIVGRDHEIVVCCPEGFWRRGNVQVLCNKYNVPLLSNKEDFLACIIDKVEQYD